MSIRRKSCDCCFRARRKCDLTYPVCQRCQRNNKTCHYQYPPQLPTREEDAANVVDTTWATEAALSNWVSRPAPLHQTSDGHDTGSWLEHSVMVQLDELERPGIPKLLGNIGDLTPVEGPSNYVFVFDQIRHYPLVFAAQAETVFIHKALYRNSFPRPLRAAFGICAGCVSLNDRNRSLLFQALDAEISELLAPVSNSTLLDDLVTLQAAVLYQTIRLFYGGVEQRIIAERQEYLLRSYGLRLLRRADTDLRGAQRTWETWILAESIRRTVLVAFKVYTMYSSFKFRRCTESEALMILPVSTKLGAWSSRHAFLQYPDQDETRPYADFRTLLNAEPPRELEPFARLLLVGSK